MQASNLVRTVIVSLSILLVATAAIGATWYSSKEAAPASPVVGVPTGEYQDGMAVYRFPSITVTASRSQELARMAKE